MNLGFLNNCSMMWMIEKSCEDVNKRFWMMMMINHGHLSSQIMSMKKLGEDDYESLGSGKARYNIN